MLPGELLVQAWRYLVFSQLAKQLISVQPKVSVQDPIALLFQPVARPPLLAELPGTTVALENGLPKKVHRPALDIPLPRFYPVPDLTICRQIGIQVREASAQAHWLKFRSMDLRLRSLLIAGQSRLYRVLAA